MEIRESIGNPKIGDGRHKRLLKLNKEDITILKKTRVPTYTLYEGAINNKTLMPLDIALLCDYNLCPWYEPCPYGGMVMVTGNNFKCKLYVDPALIPYLSTEDTPDSGICSACKKPFNEYHYYYDTGEKEEYCQCGYPNDNCCFKCGSMLNGSLHRSSGVCYNPKCSLGVPTIMVGGFPLIDWGKWAESSKSEGNNEK